MRGVEWLQPLSPVFILVDLKSYLIRVIKTCDNAIPIQGRSLFWIHKYDASFWIGA